MGTWGAGPFDNDTAADLLAGFLKPVEKVLAAKAGDSDEYNEARCAIAILTNTAGTDILGGPSLDQCLAALNRMRDDTAWLAGWRDPQEIAAALDKQILAVARAMGRHEAFEKLLAAATQAETQEAPPSSRHEILMNLSWFEWNARLRAEAAKLGIVKYSAIPLINWWASKMSPVDAAKLLKEKGKTNAEV